MGAQQRPRPRLRTENAPPRRFQLGDPEYVAHEGQSRLRQHGALGRRPSDHVFWVAPVPRQPPATAAPMEPAPSSRDRMVQVHQGDAFYAGGAPRRDEHGMFDRAPRSAHLHRHRSLPPGKALADLDGRVDAAARRPNSLRDRFMPPGAWWGRFRICPLLTGFENVIARKASVDQARSKFWGSTRPRSLRPTEHRCPMLCRSPQQAAPARSARAPWRVHGIPKIAAPLHVQPKSGLLPNTRARISAVGAVTLRRSLHSSLTCLRCTPIASASAPCVSPNGSMNSSLTFRRRSPACVS